MIKIFCDKCKKEMDSKEMPVGIQHQKPVMDKNMQTHYIKEELILCSICGKEVIDLITQKEDNVK